MLIFLILTPRFTVGSTCPVTALAAESNKIMFFIRIIMRIITIIIIIIIIW